MTWLGAPPFCSLSLLASSVSHLNESPNDKSESRQLRIWAQSSVICGILGISTPLSRFGVLSYFLAWFCKAERPGPEEDAAREWKQVANLERRASKLWSSFVLPSPVQLGKGKDNQTTLTFLTFWWINLLYEARIRDWLRRKDAEMLRSLCLRSLRGSKLRRCWDWRRQRYENTFDFTSDTCRAKGAASRGETLQMNRS